MRGGGPGKIERAARDELKTDQRDTERVLRLLMIAGCTRCGFRQSRRTPSVIGCTLRRICAQLFTTCAGQWLGCPPAAPGAVATEPELHNDTSWPGRGDRERKPTPNGGSK